MKFRAELKTIKIQKRRNSEVLRRTLSHSGIIWYQSAKMDHCLIKSCLTSAWTMLLLCHGWYSYSLFYSFQNTYLSQYTHFFSTPPRVYRHVASMVGLQMVTSFIGAAKILAAHRQTTQRQLTAEKKKNSEGPHIDSLNKRLSEMHEKITMIEEMMRKIFTGYSLFAFFLVASCLP